MWIIRDWIEIGSVVIAENDGYSSDGYYSETCQSVLSYGIGPSIVLLNPVLENLGPETIRRMSSIP
jgi:hypothetical protein